MSKADRVAFGMPACRAISLNDKPILRRASNSRMSVTRLTARGLSRTILTDLFLIIYVGSHKRTKFFINHGAIGVNKFSICSHNRTHFLAFHLKRART